MENTREQAAGRASDWYCTRNNQQEGPLSTEQVRRHLADGRLSPSDLVWRAGMPAWVPLSSVDELRAAAPAGAAPSPPTDPGADAAPTLGEPAPTYSLAGLAEAARRHFARAFGWDLRSVRLTQGEVESLGAGAGAAGRFAAWQRSLLLVTLPLTLLTAGVGLYDLVKDGFADLSALGVLFYLVGVLVLFVPPAACAYAALKWTERGRARAALLGGWAASFFAPFLFALCPLELLLRPPEGAEDWGPAAAALRVLGGLAWFTALLPPVLSLVPGTLRACLRVKSLLPASPLPGWLLLAGAPFHLLLWLIVLVALNQLAASPLLILGLLLWTGAPLLYLVRRELFVGPAASPRELRGIANVQLLVTASAYVGLALLLTYLLTKQVFGLRLFGLDEGRSFFHLTGQGLAPDEAKRRSSSWFWLLEPGLLRVVLDSLGRTLFTTAAFADVVLRMAVAAWRAQARFQGTDAAREHDDQMRSLAGGG